jgi:hypothetical protein
MVAACVGHAAFRPVIRRGPVARDHEAVGPFVGVEAKRAEPGDQHCDAIAFLDA